MDRNVRFVLGLFGAIAAGLIAGGAAWAAFAVTERTLVCERAAGECRIEENAWAGTAPRRFPLAALQGARVSSRVVPGDTADDLRAEDETRYTAILETAEGEILLSLGASDGDRELAPAVERVRAFLADPRQPALRLTLAQPPTHAYGFPAFLAGLGALIAAFTAYVALLLRVETAAREAPLSARLRQDDARLAAERDGGPVGRG